MDKEKNKNNNERVKRMAVSMQSTPVFKGEAAKRLIEMLDNPPDNSELYRKLKETPQIIKEIEKKSNGC